MKALKTYAGDFTKGHGVHELSTPIGIWALGKCKDIHKTIIDGCVGEDFVKKIWTGSYTVLIFSTIYQSCLKVRKY